MIASEPMKVRVAWEGLVDFSEDSMLQISEIFFPHFSEADSEMDEGENVPI